MVPATVGCTAAGLAGGVVDFADDAAALAGVPDGDVPEGDALVAGALVAGGLVPVFDAVEPGVALGPTGEVLLCFDVHAASAAATRTTASARVRREATDLIVQSCPRTGAIAPRMRGRIGDGT